MEGNSSLFRQEAVIYRKHRWLGQPQLLRPISATVATWCAGIAVILTGLFVTFGSYTSRVHLTGTVHTSMGVVRLSSPQAGRVIQSSASEGQRARQGDRLFVLNTDITTSAGDTSLTIIAQLHIQRKELEQEVSRRDELNREQKDNLRKQAEALDREIAQVGRQISATAVYADTLKQFADRLETLVQKRISTQTEFEVRRASYMEQRAHLETLRRDAIQLQARRQDISSKLNGFDREAASIIGELRRQTSILDQQIADREDKREILVIAPQDGTVTAVLVRAGQMVAAGTPLLSILPASGHLEVHLFASSSAIGFVRKGSQVLLRYAPFPYQKFGLYPGVVTEISRVALRATDAESIATGQAKQAPTGVYRVTVKPEQDTVLAYGQAEPLQVGMDVEADVFLDTRSIYEWILERLYSLKGSIGGPSNPGMTGNSGA